MNLKKENQMLKIICSAVIVVSIIAIIYVKQTNQSIIKEQERQAAVIESLEQAITLEDLKTEALNKKKEKANSDENIEEIAREQFGFIKSGEIVIKPSK